MYFESRRPSMPYSDPSNKEWVVQKIREIEPKKILDVGVGSGSLEHYVRANFGASIQLDGIEVWKPYISEFNLLERYNNLFIIDVKQWDNWDYDLVMFGDVLEHMPEAEAVSLWDRVSRQARSAIITIPIIHYPQGAYAGNPYEIHHEEDWNTQRVLAKFSGITEHAEFTETGAYLARFDNAKR
jgi:2-polyprenyl-3-methyl-5-hydroxy-6-metoxy-1,4-benzoquinol methylase